MARKSEQGVDKQIAGEEGSGGAAEVLRVLSDEHKKAIMAIVQNKQRMKFDQEAIRDDAKAVAERLGLKPGDINEVVSLIIKEQEKGGALKGRNHITSLAEQVLGEAADE